MISELRRDLKQLMETSGGPCVSIYLPTYRVGDIDESIIRFKNLLDEAKRRLKDMGMRAPEAARLLDPAQKLQDDNLAFWQHQSDGLAIFASPGWFKYYQLPVSFEALVTVSGHFHIKPLLRLLSRDYSFYVLALSQNSVRLLRCSRESCHVVTPRGVPSSMAEVLKYDDPEKQLQFHTRTADYQGKRAAMFHGHGVGKDDAKTDISRFSQEVAKGVQDALRAEQSPLILAAVDYLHPIYRQVNAYPHMLSQGVSGNPDGLTEKQLLERSWPVAESHFRQRRLEAVRQYEELRHTDLAPQDLKEILIAAYEGRISTLFVASGMQKWGFFDYPERVRLLEEPLPGSRDLLDLAATWTWSKGGEVYVLDPENMPNGALLAATLRY